MGQPAVFEFDEVSVSTADGQVLDRVTFTAPGHGITVIVGPSGAGKTTLLRLCNGLEVPTSGAISFRGRPLAGLDVLDLRRRVGMVFQRPTMLGGSIADNLRLAAPDSDEAALRAALDRVQLDPGLIDREADLLSVGEAQRMCLARTLLTGPEALLADEPTAALDGGRKGGIERLVQRLAGEGMPVLWVTHDLDQARRLADHLVVLMAGRVLAAGPFSAIETSADPAVAAFMDGGGDGR